MKPYLILIMLALSITAWAGPRYLGHITGPDSAFATYVQLTNRSTAPKTMTLRCHSSQGQPLKDIEVQVEGSKDAYLRPGHELPEETSSAVVYGSDRVAVTAWYESKALTDFLAAQATVHAQTQLYNGYTLLPAQAGDKRHQWNGLAITAADEPADIVIELPTGDHDPIHLHLEPHAKHTVLLRDLHPPPFTFDTPYQIYADKPFQLTILGGILGTDTAWTVQPLPAPRYPNIAFTNGTPQTQIDAPMTIRDAHLADDLLILDVTYPNGCTSGTQLFMLGGFQESFPVQATLLPVRHVREDVFCTEALIDDTLTFDLAALINQYHDFYSPEPSDTNTLTLNLLDADGKPFSQLRLEF